MGVIMKIWLGEWVEDDFLYSVICTPLKSMKFSSGIQ